MPVAQAFGWRVALRLAWRDMRSSSSRFLFVILAVAVGVGSLTGVRGFSRAFRSMLLRQARTLMAADMTVRIFGSTTPQQQDVLADLERRGIRRTQVTETLTMATTPENPQPVLVSLKAVDPALYPFYGEVKLAPPRPLGQALRADTAAVSDDLLLRLKAHPGDAVRLGGQEFRIAAVLVSEPDRMTGTLNIGPRVLITRQGLDRTGLITLGSRASERFLLRLPAGGASVDQVRLILKRAFPEGTIADFRETHPVITRGLNRATTFLSLVSLIALIVGALGVATAMHAHLQQKMDHVAVLKCLGARTSQVVRIYTLQTVLLGLAGGVLGLLFGLAVERFFPGYLARYYPVGPTLGWDFVPAFQGLAIAVLTTLLFTLPPLLGIRGIRPAIILRREMLEARPDWMARWRRSRAPLASAGVIVAGIGGIAAFLAGDTPRDALRAGAYFTGALLISLAVMFGLAWAVLRGVRALQRGSGRALPPVLRHGLANLYRPGNQARSVLVAFGVGVTFTLSVFLIQRSLVQQLWKSAPPGMPNVFMLDIPGAQRQALADLVRRQPGVQKAPEIMASVAARLEAVDGRPLRDMPLRDFGRRFLRTRSVTWADQKPPETEILSGAWWAAPATEPQVCVAEEAARILGIRPGAQLDWEIAGRTVASRAACVQRTDAVRATARFEFLFSPGTLEHFPAVYYGSVRVTPANVAALQRVLYDRFPTVTVINVADVLEIIQQVVDQIAVVVRFLSGFTILAGVIILAASVAGTRFRRMREVVILKTLGATRARVAGIFSVEFLVLGALAGLLGSALATAFSGLLLKRFLDSEFHFDLPANLVAVAAAAVLAVLAGWAASFRILGQKPLEILREE